MAGGPTSGANLKGVTLIREVPDEQLSFRRPTEENTNRRPTEERKRQEVNLREVLTEGNFQLLPELKDGDTIFVPLKSEAFGAVL